jgi:hypothetical protein
MTVTQTIQHLQNIEADITSLKLLGAERRRHQADSPPHPHRSNKEMLRKISLIINRMVCPLCLILVGFISYDILGPSNVSDVAVIKEKTIHHMKYGPSYNIKAQGDFTYNEEIEKSFYDAVTVGDTIKIHLSRFFSEWKEIEVFRGDHNILTERGSDIYAMGIFGLVFASSGLSFIPAQRIYSTILFPIYLSVVSAVGILIWFRLVQLWSGAIDKI